MSRLKDRVADESLLMLVFALYVGLRLVLLPEQVGQDGWLTLVSGREVAQHGLPSVDRLTVITGGSRWVDQQWLGQVVFYGVAHIATIKGALALHVLLASGALGVALVAARRLGGSSRSTVWITVVALPSILFTTWYMRTQSIAYALFVAVLWLLIRDARSPSPRVWFVVPLLALWTNVHGSVLLGIALVGLRGLTSIVVVRPLRMQRAMAVRGVVLIGVASACLVASPYGVELISYYGSTVGNSDFGKLITEWAPSTPGLLTASFYLLAFAAVWIVAQNGRGAMAFDRLALAMLLVAALLAIRNITWFTLAAVMILPGVCGKDERDKSEDLAFIVRFGGALLACAIVAAATASFLVRSPRSFGEKEYPSALGRSIESVARDPSARVYATERHADWLLWKYPSLTGRVAYDARLELLKGGDLSRIYRFQSQVGHGWERHADGYAIIVLPRGRGVDLPHTLPTYQVLLNEGGLKLAYRDAQSVVLVRRSEAPTSRAMSSVHATPSAR